MLPRRNAPDQRNLILAVLLSAMLIIAWQALVEAPKRRELAQWNVLHEQKKQEQAAAERARVNTPEENAVPMTREQQLAQSPRVPIASPKLSGSIALRGLRLDDLVLAKYRETIDPKSPPVTLLAPQGQPDAYFAQIGWLPQGAETARLPNDQTLWQADGKTLTPQAPLTLHWDNGAGVRFFITVALDGNYMFTITQRVENQSGAPVSVVPYGYINRAYEDPGSHAYILHEGPIGVLDSSLKEVVYKDLRDKGSQAFDQTQGWLGITDKYWLVALVPGEPFRARFDYYQKNGQDRYQVDYTGTPLTIAPGQHADSHLHFFSGAKELDALDHYAKGDAQAGIPPIPLFDRAVDFGVFYFLTKPLALFLNFLYKMVGNFGVAILLLTVCIKLLMFPLANKGYHAAAQMRALQPQMQYLRDLHQNDRVKMQQALMELYKREKVNPAAGCLPIFVQIPVFFSLYKVLYVTIEMRHAPFFGWIRDLSAADPSNIFNLFGLIPWQPPIWLHLGLLPIVMGVTMLVQMKQQPAPTDPVQAKMMKLMPYFFTLMLARMPAGLVLYWTCSNLLSIVQQLAITRRYEALKADAQESGASAKAGSRSA
ncbi:MAG: membrane protein insertase YidC [Alphaproteobacteria bacterium]|nr:membrane protein insertase YidC [Alphaproteobacteria bacterium]